MKRLALLLAGCAALGLAACDHPDADRQREARTPRAVAKLDCPERQGQLKRVAANADGLSCTYAAEGAEVVLKLVSLNGGSAEAALRPVEAELKALMPAAPDGAAAVKVAEGAGGQGDEVDISLPGLSIKANDDGAQVKVAGAEVNAEGDAAEVRIASDDNGYAGRYILANDAAADWKVVGYEARGPEGGPLAVATVKKKGDRHADGLFEDVSDLLKHTVGGQGFRGVHISADAN